MSVIQQAEIDQLRRELAEAHELIDAYKAGDADGQADSLAYDAWIVRKHFNTRGLDMAKMAVILFRAIAPMTPDRILLRIPATRGRADGSIANTRTWANSLRIVFGPESIKSQWGMGYWMDDATKDLIRAALEAAHAKTTADLAAAEAN